MQLINLLDELQKWQDAKENNRSFVSIAQELHKDGRQEVAVAVGGDRDSLLFALVAAFHKDRQLRTLCEIVLKFDEFRKQMNNNNNNRSNKGKKKGQK